MASMRRGKRQVLLNYLPGKTMDFDRIGAIARVTNVRGEIRADLNMAVVLRRVRDHARRWKEEYRPALRDAILDDPARWVLVDPRSVQATLFPKVLWCQNRACGRVHDFSSRDSLPRTCPECRQDKLVQMRHVKVHRCGALEPLAPFACSNCKSTRIALDTRGSERIAQFRWVCRVCNTKQQLFGGPCRECTGETWPEVKELWKKQDGARDVRSMDIEVHRAARTYFAHKVEMLNVPARRLDRFFALPERAHIAASKYFEMPEVLGRSLEEFASNSDAAATEQSSLTNAELDELMSLPGEEMKAAVRARIEQRQQESQASSASAVASALEERTGVERETWETAEAEMVDAVMLRENGSPRRLSDEMGEEAIRASEAAGRMGLAEVTMLNDFPVVTATYAFSRADYQPDLCRLRPFPTSNELGGRWPIFVDEVRADAVLVRLDPERVGRWLGANGFAPDWPQGSDEALARRGYFVRLFDDAPLGQTLEADRPHARLTFGLLHTLSHLCLRQAALLCGLDATSLSEYVMPRALAFVLYCNHRDGATIGALTALFEQAADGWLRAVRENRRCVYDPDCRERGGKCHACAHLSETSCSGYFNLNLSRAFAFGGPDKSLDRVLTGYFDPVLSQS